MKQVFAIGFFSIVLFSSCHYFGGQRIGGDGNVVTQERVFKDFKAVEVSGGLNLFITQDSGYSIKVEADNNLQEFIEVYKDGATLHIRQANNTNLSPSRDIKIYVSAPVFEQLGASGASSITGQNKLTSDKTFDIGLSGASRADLEIKAPGTDIDLSGACSLSLRGETRQVSIEASGASEVKAFGLLAEDVRVGVSGASGAEVYASVKISGDASGASHVRYKGNASSSVSTSGASDASKVD